MKETVTPQEIVNALEALRYNCLLHPIDCGECPFYQGVCFFNENPPSEWKIHQPPQWKAVE